MKTRRPISDFKIPAEQIKSGYYTDAYFLRTTEILNNDGVHPRILMQVFQREHSVLCGIDEAIALIKTCAHNPENIIIHALHDGDEIMPWETVMTIEGSLADFAFLETLYLGILARQTRIATNVRRTIEAAKGKQVLFFSARYDAYQLQEQDGYAAMIGGIKTFSTDANAAYLKGKGVGTIPHALIAVYDGDTVAATTAFDKHVDPSIARIALVDFDNDCVNTSLAVARKLGKKLAGVRLDTSNSMVDKTIQQQMGTFPPTGVCKELVFAVRNALDAEGFSHVKIIVSGGFTPKKIKEFEQAQVPVDTYAVGSSFFDGNLNFTADIVLRNGLACAKKGRTYLPNPKLELVK
ncbi:MAG TPA: nicotinate phosphoribosyltransferase [Candidatus Avacidaminococcus intestinavium]|uniref:nicotinate phosphoribosyltransferase n=1 Tax=Candidatus Avacidaminococcus intestinavium TaxID=2840684 RepID=A0A9D1MQS5_9FIRM|nr:nicotinate phosphoribosyltransferase [Candidatus Avacidaminococcus intestinavium]